MDTINIKVSSKVLLRQESAPGQEQIAISNITENIYAKLSSARSDNRIEIILAEKIHLTLGDTSAIWSSHNKSHEKAFIDLFNFLGKNPDQEYRFICSVA